jgi:hypothetical protein
MIARLSGERMTTICFHVSCNCPAGVMAVEAGGFHEELTNKRIAAVMILCARYIGPLFVGVVEPIQSTGKEPSVFR